MKECAKCGRQNQPTRKYCTRCGALLLRLEEEQPPAPEKPAVSKARAAPAKPPSEVVTAAEEPLVRPSKVATDRVIPPERHVEKTELEKAREAFARAEDVGIEEATGEGIVETRMLRASEVRELMDSAAGWAETAPPQPTAAPDSPETPPAPTMPTPKDIERGILGSKSEYVDKPKPVPEPSPPQPSVEPLASPPGAPSVSTVTPPKPAPTIPPQQSVKTTAKTQAPLATPPPAPATITPQDVTAEMWEFEAKVPDKAYLDDVTIKGTLSDLKHLLIELKQVQSDLSSCKSRQDESVLQYRNTAEVKRINFESLQEQAKHAKEEWNDAEKEYQRAEDRRKNEISSREKRLDKIEKQIKKAESTMTKRVKELDKEKEKLAQGQAKST
ncbi:MAG: hypothetical protein ACFFDM_02040 [Candidatus Thorarchaeota archaeon]